jgi:hypothetical protein
MLCSYFDLTVISSHSSWVELSVYALTILRIYNEWSFPYMLLLLYPSSISHLPSRPSWSFTGPLTSPQRLFYVTLRHIQLPTRGIYQLHHYSVPWLHNAPNLSNYPIILLKRSRRQPCYVADSMRNYALHSIEPLKRSSRQPYYTAHSMRYYTLHKMDPASNLNPFNCNPSPSSYPSELGSWAIHCPGEWRVTGMSSPLSKPRFSRAFKQLAGARNCPGEWRVTMVSSSWMHLRTSWMDAPNYVIWLIIHYSLPITHYSYSIVTLINMTDYDWINDTLLCSVLSSTSLLSPSCLRA